MAIQGLTLGTQRDLTNDLLIKGIIDSVVTVNQFYQVLPFKGIQGNALAYNREEAGVDAQSLVNVLRTGAGSINKDQQRFTRHNTELTTLIGDAQVNGLIQAVGSDYNDATAVQVAAKAKGLGRTYMNLMINGQQGASVAGPQFGIILSGTPTLPVVATDALPSAADFIEVLFQAAVRGNPSAQYRKGSTGSLKAVTRADLEADFDVTLSASAGIAALVLDGKLHQGALAGSTTGTIAAGTLTTTLTAAGVAAYNEAARVVHGNIGFDGLANLVSADQDVANSYTNGSDAQINGDNVLTYLDELVDRVHDKDGMVDYMMMNSAAMRKVTSAFRGVGTGFDMMDVKMSSGGIMQVQSYRGVPMYRNDFIGNSGLAGVAGGDGGNATQIYLGTVDDGSLSHGICGLTAANSAGMQVQKIGAREDVDAEITRVKWYAGLAHFSELGLVRGTLD